jgi:hypothetical protein
VRLRGPGPFLFFLVLDTYSSSVTEREKDELERERDEHFSCCSVICAVLYRPKIAS